MVVENPKLLLTLLFASCLAFAGCTAEVDTYSPGSSSLEETVEDVPADEGDDATASDVETDDTEPDAETEPEQPAEPVDCGCPLGDGPYCGARAAALAAQAGCELDPLVARDDVLYGCEAGEWTEIEACSGECKFDEASSLRRMSSVMFL